MGQWLCPGKEGVLQPSSEPLFRVGWIPKTGLLDADCWSLIGTLVRSAASAGSMS